MTESIRELMAVRPHSRECGSAVMEAARLMRDEGAGLVPVVKETTIVGTAADRDSTLRVAVGAACSPNAVTIDPQQDVVGTTREVVERIST